MSGFSIPLFSLPFFQPQYRRFAIRRVATEIFLHWVSRSVPPPGNFLPLALAHSALTFLPPHSEQNPGLLFWSELVGPLFSSLFSSILRGLLQFVRQSLPFTQLSFFSPPACFIVCFLTAFQPLLSLYALIKPSSSGLFRTEEFMITAKFSLLSFFSSPCSSYRDFRPRGPHNRPLCALFFPRGLPVEGISLVYPRDAKPLPFFFHVQL